MVIRWLDGGDRRIRQDCAVIVDYLFWVGRIARPRAATCTVERVGPLQQNIGVTCVYFGEYRGEMSAEGIAGHVQPGPHREHLALFQPFVIVFERRKLSESKAVCDDSVDISLKQIPAAITTVVDGSVLSRADSQGELIGGVTRNISRADQRSREASIRENLRAVVIHGATARTERIVGRLMHYLITV